MNDSDRDFLRKTNLGLKRRQKLKKKKVEGPGSRKPTDPQRTTRKVERHIKDRVKELETQEAQLLLKFVHEKPEIDVTIQTAETLWAFLRWLKKSGYELVHKEAVFCFPFSKLVKLKNLK